MGIGSSVMDLEIPSQGGHEVEVLRHPIPQSAKGWGIESNEGIHSPAD